MKASLIWYSFILAVVFFVAAIILRKLPLQGNVYWVVMGLAAVVFAFITYFVLIGMTKCNEGFHFEVSPRRKLGMYEGVLPVKPAAEPGYLTSVNYPIQGPGITCAKPYVGYDGAFEMNLAAFGYRPDAYSNTPELFAPLPTGNCLTGACNNVCSHADVQKMYKEDKFLPQFPKSVQESVKNYIVEQYDDKKKKMKDLNVVMFYSNECGYCKHALDMLKEAGVLEEVTLKNTSTHKLPKNANGVPHFESITTKLTQTGKPSSVDALINKLSVKEKFTENMSTSTTEMMPLSIRDLNIIVFFDKKCPFSKEAKKMFKKDGSLKHMKVVDAKKMPKSLKGVPAFVSKTTKETYIGLPKSSQHLAKELSHKSKKSDNKFSDLKIDFYYSTNCGYCVKAKEMLEKDGILSAFNMKDSSGGLPQGVTGVPAFLSKATGKVHVGKPSSSDELYNKLSVKENFGPHISGQYYEYKNYLEPGVEVVSSIAGGVVPQEYPCGTDDGYTGCSAGLCPKRVTGRKYLGISGV